MAEPTFVYDEFWDRENPSWAIQKSVQILEDRVSNPRSPEDAEAARSILMNGPREGEPLRFC